MTSEWPRLVSFPNQEWQPQLLHPASPSRPSPSSAIVQQRMTRPFRTTRVKPPGDRFGQMAGLGRRRLGLPSFPCGKHCRWGVAVKRAYGVGAGKAFSMAVMGGRGGKVYDAICGIIRGRAQVPLCSGLADSGQAQLCQECSSLILQEFREIG